MTNPEKPAKKSAPKISKGRQKKSASRLYAVQALFQMETSGQTIEDVVNEFQEHRFGAVYEGDEMMEGNMELFKTLVENAVDQQASIDQMTNRALVAKWPIARIDPTLRALFRASGAEFVLKDTPPRVVISEFVDIARAFHPDGKEPQFVNAVLDHMAREANPDAFA